MDIIDDFGPDDEIAAETAARIWMLLFEYKNDSFDYIDPLSPSEKRLYDALTENLSRRAEFVFNPEAQPILEFKA